MKKTLKGIDKTTVVHCSTEELANKVLEIAHEAGYMWSRDEAYIVIQIIYGMEKILATI